MSVGDRVVPNTRLRNGKHRGSGVKEDNRIETSRPGDKERGDHNDQVMID